MMDVQPGILGILVVSEYLKPFVKSDGRFVNPLTKADLSIPGKDLAYLFMHNYIEVFGELVRLKIKGKVVLRLSGTVPIYG